MSEVLSLATLRMLVDQWIADGRRVAGPRLVNDRLLYDWLESAGQLALDGAVRPRNSIKEFLFPRHETLYGYKLGRKRVELTEITPPQAEQIVIAARPCDAALGPILDHVFNWDYADASFNRRRELTTIVTLACQNFDAQCFCTSVEDVSDVSGVPGARAKSTATARPRWRRWPGMRVDRRTVGVRTDVSGNVSRLL